MDQLTEPIRAASEVTVARANELLKAFGEDRKVNSGWRPAAVNAATPGAAQFSKHMLGKAIDIADPEGDLDEWCMHYLDVLEDIGLWQEHPASTKGWCHVQIVPPKSGNRVFYP
jgi:hypothetical protein